MPPWSAPWLSPGRRTTGCERPPIRACASTTRPPLFSRSSMLNLSLAEAADAIRRGKISSLELTRAALERARSLGPKLNCFALLDGDDALKAARKADRAPRKGRGPLHGVPLAHKDFFDRKGRAV